MPARARADAPQPGPSPGTPRNPGRPQRCLPGLSAHPPLSTHSPRTGSEAGLEDAGSVPGLGQATLVTELQTQPGQRPALPALSRPLTQAASQGGRQALGVGPGAWGVEWPCLLGHWGARPGVSLLKHGGSGGTEPGHRGSQVPHCRQRQQLGCTPCTRASGGEGEGSHSAPPPAGSAGLGAPHRGSACEFP